MRKLTDSLCLLVIVIMLAACSSLTADLADPLLPELEAPATLPAPTSTVALPAAQAEPQAETPTVDECTNCHSNQELLMASAEPEVQTSSESTGINLVGELTPMQPWEKAYINVENFIPTVHGQVPCTSCHGGVQSTDKATAHTNLVARPSAGQATACAGCHTDVTQVYADSLHADQAGFWYALDMRSLPDSHAALEEMFGDHCSSCHTSCGDCHVSQPATTGGGLLDGHVFLKQPSMTRSCIACHATRTGNEYLGMNDGYPGDIHYRRGNMTCVDCHTSHQLHGMQSNCDQCHDGPESGAMPPDEHRYDGVETPSCESCHPMVATGKDDVKMHKQHGGDLSCQVCHSVSYSSCDACHVQISDETGEPYYTATATTMTFLIGRNTLKSFDRPYEYVPVRHIPITPDSFQYYGEDLLENFTLLPTWAYATPHNIQIITPQNRNCNTCHGNADIFLTADKVRPEELEANLGVIVSEVPPLISDSQPAAETP